MDRLLTEFSRVAALGVAVTAKSRMGIDPKAIRLEPHLLLSRRPQEIRAARGAAKTGVDIPMPWANRVVLGADVRAGGCRVIDLIGIVEEVQRHLLWVGVSKNVHSRDERSNA